MVWIYAIPAWIFMPAAVLVACVLASALLYLVRTRVTRNETIAHNDVAGPILGTIGTILAVMMSFMVVGVWEEYDQSAQNVQVEAGALSDLHHLADAFPQAARNHLKAQIDRYIHDVVSLEWPLMRRGGESFAAHMEAYDIEATITRLQPATAAQAAVQQSAIERVQRFLDARRQRIHDNSQGIPPALWSTLMLVGLITVLSSFYFRVDRAPAHYVMVLALTVVIAVTFSVIAELDYPFRGDIAISPEPFLRAYQTVHNIGYGQ